MLFDNQKQTSRIALKIGSCVILTLIIGVGILRIKGEIIAVSSYSKNFGRIKVRAMAVSPWSLEGMLGIEDKFYRCEFFSSPKGPLDSAISLRDGSYEPTEVKITWESARKATVSFDSSIYYKLEEGIWSRMQQGRSGKDSTR